MVQGFSHSINAPFVRKVILIREIGIMRKGLTAFTQVDSLPKKIAPDARPELHKSHT